MNGQVSFDFMIANIEKKEGLDLSVKNCYNCDNSEIFKKPHDYGEYVVHGCCHKNGGNYKIYVPGAKCKDYLATS